MLLLFWYQIIVTLYPYTARAFIGFAFSYSFQGLQIGEEIFLCLTTWKLDIFYLLVWLLLLKLTV